jgi:putative endonuclease
VSEYSVYVLRCGDGSYYTGIAMDVEQRLAEHEGGVRGAKYLRGRGPLQLVFARPVGDRGQAQRVEARLKKLPSRLKADVDGLPARVDALLAELCVGQ